MMLLVLCQQLEIIEHGSMIVGHDGRIVAVGPEAELAQQFAHATFETDVDATNKCVLPGIFLFLQYMRGVICNRCPCMGWCRVCGRSHASSVEW